MKQLILTILLLALSALASAAIPVVATFSILGDITQQLGGKHIEVDVLVGPEQDAHTYQPTTSDLKRIIRARLVLAHGLGFDQWVQKMLTSARYKGAYLQASQGLQTRHSQQTGHHHSEVDPHLWQDISLTRQYVENISAALIRLDPAHTADYQANKQRYLAQMQAVDEWAQNALAQIPLSKRVVLTSHDAFGYLGARYQIRFLAPVGVNTEAEASAQDVVKIIRQARTQKIRALFVENISNPRLLEQLSKETGSAISGKLFSDALSAAQGPAPTYLTMYRHNLQQLVTAMKLNP